MLTKPDDVVDTFTGPQNSPRACVRTPHDPTTLPARDEERAGDGFEPLSLRHEIGSSTCTFAEAVLFWSVLGPWPLRQGRVANHLRPNPRRPLHDDPDTTRPERFGLRCSPSAPPARSMCCGVASRLSALNALAVESWTRACHPIEASGSNSHEVDCFLDTEEGGHAGASTTARTAQSRAARRTRENGQIVR
jgi:hypothetical protein